MTESFVLETVIPTTPAELFRAWMDSATHSAFTGSPAEIGPAVGASFTAWDGYISGFTLELNAHERIVQAWRTTEFPHDSLNSQIELVLAERPEGTHLTLRHTGIPDGQAADYRSGWDAHYFEPLKRYFGGTAKKATPAAAASPTKKAPPKKPAVKRKAAAPKRKAAAPKRKPSKAPKRAATSKKGGRAKRR